MTQQLPPSLLQRKSFSLFNLISLFEHLRLAVCFCGVVVWEFVVIPAAISSLATGTPFLKCGTATLCQVPREFMLWRKNNGTLAGRVIPAEF